MDRARDKALLWWRKWRWYERNSLPWNRARLHLEFARREAFVWSRASLAVPAGRAVATRSGSAAATSGA